MVSGTSRLREFRAEARLRSLDSLPPASVAEFITSKRIGSLGKILKYSASHPVRKRAQSIFLVPVA